MSELNIYQKLNKVRKGWVDLGIKPTGSNSYTKAKYFEEGDLIPNGINLSETIGLVPIFNLVEDEAELVVYDTTSDKSIRFAISRADAGLKSVTPVQQLGAEITYLKRYLWRIYLEAVETDVLDSNVGSGKLETEKEFTHLEEINMLIQDSQFDIDTVYDWIEKKWGKRTPIDELKTAQFSELKNSLLAAIAKKKQVIKEPEEDKTPYNCMK